MHGGAAMTNGTVKTSATASGVNTTSAMTNGTVKSTSNAHCLVLTVDYGQGEKAIEVASDVPVVGVVPADSSKLLPGAPVFVTTKKDAPKSAAFVAVGIDGTVPPMQVFGDLGSPISRAALTLPAAEGRRI